MNWHASCLFITSQNKGQSIDPLIKRELESAKSEPNRQKTAENCGVL